MNRYLVQAFNYYDSINIKVIRSLLSGKVIDSSPQELQLQYGENSYMFVFRFGCVVYFNMLPESIEKETSKLKAALGEGLEFPTSETYTVHVGDFAPRVEFEYVELKKLTLDVLRLIALSLGQSAALEYFEIKADRMLFDTSSFMENLSKRGTLPRYSKSLLKIIGSTAGTRQRILTHLAILDPPEETWKSKELEKLYKELQQNFDIDIRFRSLDRKLQLLQDNIEIITDLTASRRANLLEASIVLLIVFELAVAIFGHFGHR